MKLREQGEQDASPAMPIAAACAHGSGEDAPSSKEMAYACLKRWIVYSELKPGTALAERELAERFGISRTPLREILQRLSYQRLIVIRPRKGIVVAPIDETTIRDTFEVRLPLERTAAALAAQRATPAHVAELAGLVRQMRTAFSQIDLTRHIQLDQTFHETLARATGNTVLAETLEDLHTVCLRFWNLSRETIQERYKGLEELEQVTEAIRQRDARRAAEVHSRHVASFLTTFDAVARLSPDSQVGKPG